MMWVNIDLPVINIGPDLTGTSNYQSRAEKQIRRETFKSKRRMFDKTRLYISGVHNRIDNSDPRTFWNEIKKLGPKKQRINFDSVLLPDGNESCDKEEIKQKWKNDFEALFNDRLDNEGNTEFDE